MILRAIRIAWPACLLSAAFLASFLPKAFTIDDTIFLRGAEQAQKTPLHPFAYSMCWDADGHSRPVSQYVPNAPVMSYLLIPAVRSPHPEVAGHLLQIVLLIAALIFTASSGLRLGLSRPRVTMATTLLATCPAVLGMAATVMPDILAMTLGVVAFERFLAYIGNRHPAHAAVAVAALALAPLARPHLALMIPVCALISLQPLLAISAVVSVALNLLTKPDHAQMLSTSLIRLEPLRLATRAVSYGDYLALTSPFVLCALPLLWRRLPACLSLLLPAVPLVFFLITQKFYWILLAVSELAFLILAFTLTKLWRTNSKEARSLCLWAMLPIAVCAYPQMAPKYLDAAMPAYCLILALLIPSTRIWQPAAAMGLILSFLIVSGDRTAADMARQAVQTWLPVPNQPTYFQGQWGFQWYAEHRGATCFDPAIVHPGGIVIVDKISGGTFPLKDAIRISEMSNAKPTGLVMDTPNEAGFFSDGFGRLPWYYSPPDTLRFELWQLVSHQ